MTMSSDELGFKDELVEPVGWSEREKGLEKLVKLYVGRVRESNFRVPEARES